MKTSSVQPLIGKRILITRSREQASTLAEKLQALGAEPILLPVIQFSPPKDFTPLDQAILNIIKYDWAIFTSTNGVQFFFNRLLKLGYNAAHLSQVKIAAIGPATAAELVKNRLHVDLVPSRYLTEEIVNGMGNITDQHILLPRADIADRALMQTLRSKGARVDEITAYRTLSVENDSSNVMKRLNEAQLDILTFTSASSVHNFAKLLKITNYVKILQDLLIACIGPVTAKAAEEELGLKAQIIADEYTIDGLINAIVNKVNCHAKNRK